jgi:hypothetical protein
VAGPIQRYRVLTRSTGCRQQASRKFISRKNEKLLDKQQSSNATWQFSFHHTAKHQSWFQQLFHWEDKHAKRAWLLSLQRHFQQFWDGFGPEMQVRNTVGKQRQDSVKAA